MFISSSFGFFDWRFTAEFVNGHISVMYVFNHKASLFHQKEPGTAASAARPNFLMCHCGTSTTGSLAFS
jgi:hypothetical protein